MKVLFIFLFVFLFSCASEEETEKCNKGSVYNNNYNICVNNPCEEGEVKHQCYEIALTWTKNCYCIEGCYTGDDGHIRNNHCLAILEENY